MFWQVLQAWQHTYGSPKFELGSCHFLIPTPLSPYHFLSHVSLSQCIKKKSCSKFKNKVCKNWVKTFFFFLFFFLLIIMFKPFKLKFIFLHF